MQPIKNEERKVTAIIALVMGGIALVTSWIPFVNNASAILAIIAFILGVIALFINLKRKKSLSLISIMIAVVSFVIVLVTQASYGAVLDNAFEKSSELTSRKTDNKSGSSISDSNSSKKTYKVGDKITFDGKLEITITSVEWTDERNMFDDSNPEKVLKVTYDITNLSDEDYPVGSELNLYAGGEKMETYPNDNTFETISSGRSYQGATQHFGVTSDGDLELEIEPSFSVDGNPVIVKLER
ncbi:immunity protein [Streptococcus dentasini]